MAALEAVLLAGVERDHVEPAGLADATVDGDDAAFDVEVGRVRGVGEHARRLARHHQVAGADLLDRGDDLQRGRLAALGDPGGAEIGGFPGDRRARARVLERTRGAVDVPELGLVAHVLGEDGVAGAGQHAAGLGGDDGGRAVEAGLVDHQRAIQEGLDDLQRDAGQGLGDRLVVDPRLQAAVCSAATADPAADAEPGAAAVEQDDLAGVDEVRVADLVAVQSPHLGPAPGLLQETPGDAPQGVAAFHGVAVGGVGGEADAGLRVRTHAEEAREGDEQREYNSLHWTLPIGTLRAGSDPERTLRAGVEATERVLCTPCIPAADIPAKYTPKCVKTLEILHSKA